MADEAAEKIAALTENTTEKLAELTAAVQKASETTVADETAEKLAELTAAVQKASEATVADEAAEKIAALTENTTEKLAELTAAVQKASETTTADATAEKLAELTAAVEKASERTTADDTAEKIAALTENTTEKLAELTAAVQKVGDKSTADSTEEKFEQLVQEVRKHVMSSSFEDTVENLMEDQQMKLNEQHSRVTEGLQQLKTLICEALEKTADGDSVRALSPNIASSDIADAANSLLAEKKSTIVQLADLQDNVNELYNVASKLATKKEVIDVIHNNILHLSGGQVCDDLQLSRSGHERGRSVEDSYLGDSTLRHTRISDRREDFTTSAGSLPRREEFTTSAGSLPSAYDMSPIPVVPRCDSFTNAAHSSSPRQISPDLRSSFHQHPAAVPSLNLPKQESDEIRSMCLVLGGGVFLHQ